VSAASVVLWAFLALLIGWFGFVFWSMFDVLGRGWRGEGVSGPPKPPGEKPDQR
jgi:hypothetical protein